MTLPPYTKPTKSTADILAHLGTCGLSINDKLAASKIIEDIGYYRLRIYFLSRRDVSNKPLKPFRIGTTFEDIISIYRFDEELRMLLLLYCGRVEILVRSIITDEICGSYGSHPYYDGNMYANADSKVSSYKDILTIVHKKMKNDARAKHYYANYSAEGDKIFPPIWTVREFLNFGSLNYFFSRLNHATRNSIAKRLRLKDGVMLQNWIDCFVDMRNVCAHHDRLFNRNFQKKLQVYKPKGGTVCPGHSQDKVAGLVDAMEHILGYRGTTVDIHAKIRPLLAQHQMISASELGY